MKEVSNSQSFFKSSRRYVKSPAIQFSLVRRRRVNVEAILRESPIELEWRKYLDKRRKNQRQAGLIQADHFLRKVGLCFLRNPPRLPTI